MCEHGHPAIKAVLVLACISILCLISKVRSQGDEIKTLKAYNEEVWRVMPYPDKETNGVTKVYERAVVR